MKKRLIQLCIVLSMVAGTSQSMALTDSYFATGEDLDFLSESNNSYAIKEIEYKLRRFVLFRKLEDYLFDLTDTYFEEDE
jgi:hypothetical protein